MFLNLSLIIYLYKNIYICFGNLLFHLTDLEILSVHVGLADSFKLQKSNTFYNIRSLQSLSRVWPFATPETAAKRQQQTPLDCSSSGFPVYHQLPEVAQTHVHRVGDAIQPSRPLLSPSPPAFSLSQHQGLFQWVRFLHQVAKVLEFQLQCQSFQWTPRTDLL